MLSGMRLTNREQMVAALVCDGLSNKVIAKQLGLSEGTVKAHVLNIFKKVGVRSRGALILLGHEALTSEGFPAASEGRQSEDFT